MRSSCVATNQHTYVLRTLNDSHTQTHTNRHKHTQTHTHPHTHTHRHTYIYTHTSLQYPVHVAAEGGSLTLLRWLVDELGCPLYDEEDKPLRTQPRGDSVLGVAARRRHAHVMRWLVVAKQCKVAEIADRAQLVATVEFLLLGEESGASSGGRLLPMSSEGYAEEEVKQHEAFDYASGGEEQEDEEGWARRQLREGHELSGTAAGAVKRKGKGKAKTVGKQPEGGSAGAVVDECLLCGVRAYVHQRSRVTVLRGLGYLF